MCFFSSSFLSFISLSLSLSFIYINICLYLCFISLFPCVSVCTPVCASLPLSLCLALPFPNPFPCQPSLFTSPSRVTSLSRKKHCSLFLLLFRAFFTPVTRLNFVYIMRQERYSSSSLAPNIHLHTDRKNTHQRKANLLLSDLILSRLPTFTSLFFSPLLSLSIFCFLLLLLIFFNFLAVPLPVLEIKHEV